MTKEKRKTLPDFESEAVRLMNAVKTMNSFDAKNEIKGILENTYIRGTENGKK